jgi:hypothetical protein
LLPPPCDTLRQSPHRSAAFRPCHYPHLFRTHISTSTWYSKTPGKPRELGLPPSTDGVHALSAKSCATARRSRAADHRFVKRSGIMTYIISLTQQTLQKMWVMTRPLGCRSTRLPSGASKSQRSAQVSRFCSLMAARRRKYQDLPVPHPAPARRLRTTVMGDTLARRAGSCLTAFGNCNWR